METTGFDIEQNLWTRGLHLVAGVDEAGRGCLAGPVVAAAVILPPSVMIEGVRDSKALSQARRDELAIQIRAVATGVGVGVCSPEEIDQMNILWASMEAMKRALLALHPQPEFVLIDGNRCFPDPQWPVEMLVGGDNRCHSIAAASIIAKTTRDRIMRDLAEEYPHYGWSRNVGYPTREHYDALAAFGPCSWHRRSFRLEA